MQANNFKVANQRSKGMVYAVCTSYNKAAIIMSGCYHFFKPLGER